MEDNKIGRGWIYLINSPKWHFFKDDGKSLCGRWASFSKEGFQYGNDNSPDNCKACLKKLIKLRTQNEKGTTNKL